MNRIRKKTLVQRVVIAPETFAITLIDDRDRTRTPLPAKVVMKLVRSLFGVNGLAGAAGFVTSLSTGGYC